MNKWVKRLLIGGVSVALLVLIGLGVLYVCLGSIIKTGVETLGPKITKCSVTVEQIDVAPLAGRVEIHKMVVGNPEGFKTESAFALHHIRVALDARSLLSNRIHIHEILIDGPEITYEVGSPGAILVRSRRMWRNSPGPHWTRHPRNRLSLRNLLRRLRGRKCSLMISV